MAPFWQPSPFIVFGGSNTEQPIKSSRKERINACRHMLLVSHRNWQLGDAFPDVFLSLQWPWDFVLYGMRPLHSIGVPDQVRSPMHGLWGSLSRCNPLRHLADSFLRRRTFPSLLSIPTSLTKERLVPAPLDDTRVHKQQSPTPCGVRLLISGRAVR